MTLYATAITHNTFDPSNTLSPAFSIPAIPAYPVAPTPVPTFPPNNPVYDGVTATAVHNQTVQDVLSYNGQVAHIDALIHSAAARVKSSTARLTDWNPPVDNIATSILGCFELAAARFQGVSGGKLLYIASDLENNTNVDYTQNFVTQRGLAGAIVHVIYFYSTNAARDQQKRALWCPYVTSAGARAVLFSDPGSSQTLSDVFDKDLQPPAFNC